MKLGKKSKYNLSDGEEDEYEIQDGSGYPERDDFEDEVPFDEEDGEATEAESKFAICSPKYELNSSLKLGVHFSWKKIEVATEDMNVLI